MGSNILSLRNIILGVGLFATVVAIYLFAHPSSKGSVAGDVVVWGTIPAEGMDAITQQFNPQARTYAVRYVYVAPQAFNQKLLEALASGSGPDMILAPYQTILSQASRIQPFPIASLPEKTFKDMYVDGASVLFGSSGALALPVSVEPMVLFYNRTLLSKHGIVNPPETWDVLGAITPALTVKEGSRIIESAIALGTPEIPYAKEIIMTIVAQLGQVPVVVISNANSTSYTILVNEPVTEESQVYPLATVLRYFTQFGDSSQTFYTWNTSLGAADDMFVSEKLAMYIGFSGEYATLRARNPRADIGMTFLPQTKGYNTFATGMRMYALATLKSSKNLTAALTVESQFASGGVAPSIAASVGGVAPMKNTAGTQGLDPVIARSMLVARGWYDSHEKESTSYATTMISDVLNSRYGVSDAAELFVSRLRDLYTNQ